MQNRVLLPLVMIITLAGCATPDPPPPPPPEPKAEVLPPTLPPLPEPRNDKLKHLANRNLKPMETRPLNSKANCSFRDPTGYRGKLRLDVREANVKRFEASINVPKRGNCSFDMKHFYQTHSLPIVILSAKQGDCKVRLWEQGNKVTVAFRDCRKECSGNSIEYLWPILVDNRKGSCA